MEMEELLKSFQTSLGDISSEIRHLQDPRDPHPTFATGYPPSMCLELIKTSPFPEAFTCKQGMHRAFSNVGTIADNED